MIQTFQLPSPPPESNPTFQGWLQWISQYGNTLYTYLNTWESALSKQFNTLFNDSGLDIAAAGTITVSAAVHQVTGTALVTQINQPPGQTAVSVVTLYAKAGFSLGTGGNVASAMAVPKGASVMLAYHPALKLWLCSGNSQAVRLATSTDSPFAAQGGQYLFVRGDTGPFVANLSATPGLGDLVFLKTLSGSSNASQLTAAGGFTIDGLATVLAVGVSSTAALMYTGNNDWESIYKST